MNETLTGYQFDIIADPNSQTQEAVYGMLREFNRMANPVFWVARDSPEHAARPLHVFVYNPQRQVVAGLFGEMQFSWLKVTIMAVHEALRGGGIGRQLMRVAEAEAVRRGCRYAYVDTIDYQAPDFYLALGYEIAGQLKDWDSHGHDKLFLTRELI